MKKNITGGGISREESNSIKGLLILLIALGHNSILCASWDGCELVQVYFHNHWLYQFHVYVFFMLPFVYNEFSYRKGNLEKYVVRMLWPYLWICMICLCTSYVMGKPFAGWGNLVETLITGNIVLLGRNVGGAFPWFLMTMFSLLLLKDIYYTCTRVNRVLLICVGLFFWIFAAMIGETSPIKIESPFSIACALLLLPMCISGLLLSKRINLAVMSSWWLGGIFILLTILFWYAFYEIQIVELNLLLRFVMPISAFLLLLSVRNYLAKSKLLIALGKMSLPIYLYHVLIYNALLVLVKHFHCPPSWLDGIVTYVATLIISYVGALITMKVSFLRKILYPGNAK